MLKAKCKPRPVSSGRNFVASPPGHSKVLDILLDVIPEKAGSRARAGVNALGLKRVDGQELLLLHQACLDLGEELLLTEREPTLEVQGCKLGWKGSQALVLIIPDCTVLV